MENYQAGTPGAHPHAGKTLLEIIWEELDEVMDRLMADGVPSTDMRLSQGYGTPEMAEAFRRWGEERGQAQGLAYALAVLTNPYHVDVDAIRAQAVARWKERHDG